jgi:hypothetical protein
VLLDNLKGDCTRVQLMEMVSGVVNCLAVSLPEPFIVLLVGLKLSTTPTSIRFGFVPSKACLKSTSPHLYPRYNLLIVSVSLSIVVPLSYIDRF